MAKVFKISAYIVDPMDELDDYSLEELLDDYRPNDFHFRHIEVESADIGEWDDDCPLNYLNCPTAEFEKYFKEKK